MMKMNEIDLKEANKLYTNGDLERLYEFIKPYIAKNDPNAMYIYSKFSLDVWNETDEEYDKRFFECLKIAADGGVAEAQYKLSSFYFVGEDTPMDIEKGKMYLENAAELNYGQATLTLGVNLYYGSNGYMKNLSKSKKWIEKAIYIGVDGALETLAKLEKE